MSHKWTHMKFKPKQLDNGDWFVKTKTKQGQEWGQKFTTNKEFEVEINPDCMNRDTLEVGDALAHGTIIECLGTDGEWSNTKFLIEQTPEGQAIAFASTANKDWFEFLMNRSIDNMCTNGDPSNHEPFSSNSNFVTTEHDIKVGC